MLWTDEETRELITLWPMSSASQIAKQLKRPRGAVAGKVKRLREEGVLPAEEIKRYDAVPVQARPKRTPPVIPRPAPAVDGTVPCSILELDDSRCHWPLGEVHAVAVLFCGGAAVADCPYCECHMRMARGERPPTPAMGRGGLSRGRAA
jgi:GcrA cell cycle regulator